LRVLEQAACNITLPFAGSLAVATIYCIPQQWPSVSGRLIGKYNLWINKTKLDY